MRPDFMPRLKELFQGFTSAELEAKVAAAGLPYAPIARPEDLFEDVHLRASGGLLPLTLPDSRQTVTPALPFELGGRRLGVRLDPPGIGAHSREILAELGFSAREIAALGRKGIIGGPVGKKAAAKTAGPKRRKVRS
jgi:crotonobetainyl-CoA:carnitine CoA-transferase CaiB-like acyl-CoA transferase